MQSGVLALRPVKKSRSCLCLRQDSPVLRECVAWVLRGLRFALGRPSDRLRVDQSHHLVGQWLEAVALFRARMQL